MADDPVGVGHPFAGKAAGVARVDHVGIGTDQMGLQGPSCMPSYADLPQLAAALSSRFKPDEIAKLLGGNYRRVFEACVA